MNQQKNNTGALFKNTRKETDNHPDYNGTVLVNGQHMWISAWLKESGRGTKYMSLSFKPKDSEPQQTYDTGRSKPMPSADLDDDVPF